MGRAIDLFVTYRFLKLLTTPFEKTEAFKLGIIDEKATRKFKYLSNDQYIFQSILLKKNRSFVHHNNIKQTLLILSVTKRVIRSS